MRSNDIGKGNNAHPPVPVKDTRNSWVGCGNISIHQHHMVDHVTELQMPNTRGHPSKTEGPTNVGCARPTQIYAQLSPSRMTCARTDAEIMPDSGTGRGKGPRVPRGTVRPRDCSRRPMHPGVFGTLTPGLFRGSGKSRVYPEMHVNLPGDMPRVGCQVSQEISGLPRDDWQKTRGCYFRVFSSL
jgi:hypothetical protein